MSKFYNKNVCSEDEVWKALDKSEQFGWSWCRDRAEPFRHTAIVLYFDGNPEFTVNFRTENGASKAAAAFSEAKQLITVEYLADTDYECFTPLQEFPVKSPIGKRRARNTIQSILSYEPGNYNLFVNNCRSHVQGVVKSILGENVPDELFTKKMDEVKSSDIMKEFLCAVGAMVAIGGTTWVAYKLIKRKDRVKQTS